MIKKMTRKAILLLLSGILLLVGLLYLSVAWYTKMVNISDATFKVAEWDLRAAYQLSDFDIKVNRYDTVCNDFAAPGTAGYIPIVLQTTLSDTDAKYVITVDKSTMSKEFQRRLFFYKLVDNAYVNMESAYIDDIEPTIEGSIIRHNDDHDHEVTVKAEKTEKVYWKWIYEYEDLLKEGPQGIKYVLSDIEEYFKPETVKARLGITEWSELFAEDKALDAEGKRLKNKYTGDATAEGYNGFYNTVSNLYPAGITDINELIIEYLNPDKKTYEALTDYKINLLSNDAKAARSQFLSDMSREHDIFDTEVGKYPEVYSKYMNASLHIVGDEIKPIISENNSVTN